MLTMTWRVVRVQQDEHVTEATFRRTAWFKADPDKDGEFLDAVPGEEGAEYDFGNEVVEVPIDPGQFAPGDNVVMTLVVV